MARWRHKLRLLIRNRFRLDARSILRQMTLLEVWVRVRTALPLAYMHTIALNRDSAKLELTAVSQCQPKSMWPVHSLLTPHHNEQVG